MATAVLADGAASTTTRVYQDDTVKRRGSDEVGLAVRCWYSEEEGHYPEVEQDSLERPVGSSRLGHVQGIEW